MEMIEVSRFGKRPKKTSGLIYEKTKKKNEFELIVVYFVYI